jgi:hypothetical protein
VVRIGIGDRAWGRADEERIAGGVGVAHHIGQAVERRARGMERAEHEIERAVLEHQDDEVLDRLQAEIRRDRR